jgi:hypothetical protein
MNIYLTVTILRGNILNDYSKKDELSLLYEYANLKNETDQQDNKEEAPTRPYSSNKFNETDYDKIMIDLNTIKFPETALIEDIDNKEEDDYDNFDDELENMLKKSMYASSQVNKMMTEISKYIN